MKHYSRTLKNFSKRLQDYSNYYKVLACQAYTPSTHTLKDEDELLLEFLCIPTRTRIM
jgi:hypothetical protein